MAAALEILFTRVWWTWDPRTSDPFSQVYHLFNLLEALVWLTMAGLVLKRFLRARNSLLEIAYSVAFLTFAVSDVFEAWEQSSLLIWLKLINLLVLFGLRRTVMTRWYPTSRLY